LVPQTVEQAVCGPPVLAVDDDPQFPVPVLLAESNDTPEPSETVHPIEQSSHWRTVVPGVEERLTGKDRAITIVRRYGDDP
jgi:hypothetical protein